MAGKNRRQVSDLRKNMLDSAPSYSFYQVIRLLNQMGLTRVKIPGDNNLVPENFKAAGNGYNNNKYSGQDSYFKNIRIKPNLSMAFPVAGVEKIIENRSDQSFDITANFLNLYGTLSPLPSYYTEDLIEEERFDESFIRDFLDILNQRLYELCFLAWSKYRSMMQIHEIKNPYHEERLYCIGGFGSENARQKITEPFRLLRYSGLFAMGTRSAVGLETLLTDATGYKANITQCVNRKSPIPENQWFCLGEKNTTLNEDSYLGREISDSLSEFKISFGPFEDEKFRDFLSGTEMYRKIVELVKLYLVDSFLFVIEVLVKGSHIKHAVLDSPENQWGSLGLDTWLYSDETIETSPISFSEATC